MIPFIDLYFWHLKGGHLFMFLRNNRMFKIKLLFNLINLSNRPQVSVSFASIIELPGAALLEWGPYWKINKNTFEGGVLIWKGVLIG